MNNQAKKRPVQKKELETSHGIFKLNERTLLFLSVVILTIVTLVTFWPNLHASFTNWDDPDYVLANTRVQRLSGDNIRLMFAESNVSNYHPLTLLSLAIDYARANINKQTGNPEAFPFHQTNIILHIFNVLLVFYIFYLLSKRKIAVAFITAFLFGIHPMHVESVAWITERKDVLFGFFFLISLLCYLKYADGNRRWGYWLSLFFFLLSLLSKPAAAPLGLILLLVDYYQGRFDFTKPGLNAGNLKLIIEKIPFLLLGLVFILITYFIQSETNIVADFQLFSLPRRILISFYAFFMYLQKLVVPVNLSAFYPYPFNSSNTSVPINFYIAGILTAAIIILTFLSVKKTRVILFGIFFYLFMLLPVLQFVSVGSAIISERYTYIPYIGIFFMTGMGIYQLWNTRQNTLMNLRYPVMVLVLLYMGTLTVLARERVSVWNNSGTLWTDVIQQFPNVPTAYKNRGNYYASEANEIDKALSDYEKLLTLDSTDASIYSNLGNIYTMKEEYHKAIEVYSRSMLLDSMNHRAPFLTSYSYNNYLNHGFSSMQISQYTSAITDYSLLLEKYPGVEKFYFNRGVAYANTGRIQEAKADFMESLKLDANGPNHGAGLYNLAACHVKLGDLKSALNYFRQAQSAGYPVDPAIVQNIERQVGIKRDTGK